MWGFSTTGPSVGLVVVFVLLATTAAQPEQAGCSIDDNTTFLGLNQTLHQTDLPSFPFPVIPTLGNLHNVVTSMWNFANQLIEGMFPTGNGSDEFRDMAYFRNASIETSSEFSIRGKHTESDVLRKHDTIPANLISHDAPPESRDRESERQMIEIQISGLEVMIAERNTELKKIDMILEKLDLIQQLELSFQARPSLQDATQGLTQSYEEERIVLTHSILDLEQRLGQATRKKLDMCQRPVDGRRSAKSTLDADEEQFEAGHEAAAPADGSMASYKTDYPISIYRSDIEESAEVCNFTDSPISNFEFFQDACTPGYDCPPHTVHLYITRPVLIASFSAEETQASVIRDPFMYKPFIQNFPVEVYIPKSWTDIVLENWLALFSETCVVMYQFFIVVKKFLIRRFRRKRSRVRRER